MTETAGNGSAAPDRRAAAVARGVARRMAASAGRLVLFLVLLDLFLFLLFDLLPDAASVQLGVFGVDPAQLAAARSRMGLTGPWHRRLTGQWLRWLRGDLGH